MNNTKKGTTIISTTLAGLITVSAACRPENEDKLYVKDNHIQIQTDRVREGSSLRFQSGCNYLSATIYPTYQGPAYHIEIHESFNFDCASKPHIQEVDNFLSLIYRYAMPDLSCELFDHEGKKYRPSRFDAPLLTRCHEHKDAKKIGECLLAEAPLKWKVDCK